MIDGQAFVSFLEKHEGIRKVLFKGRDEQRLMNFENYALQLTPNTTHIPQTRKAAASGSGGDAGTSLAGASKGGAMGRLLASGGQAATRFFMRTMLSPMGINLLLGLDRPVASLGAAGAAAAGDHIAVLAKNMALVAGTIAGREEAALKREAEREEALLDMSLQYGP